MIYYPEVQCPSICFYFYFRPASQANKFRKSYLLANHRLSTFIARDNLGFFADAQNKTEICVVSAISDLLTHHCREEN